MVFLFFKILFLEEMDSEPQQLNAISYTLFIGHSRRDMLVVKHFSKKYTGGGEEPGRTNYLSQQMPRTFAHLHKIVA